MPVAERIEAIFARISGYAGSVSVPTFTSAPGGGNASVGRIGGSAPSQGGSSGADPMAAWAARFNSAGNSHLQPQGPAPGGPPPFSSYHLPPITPGGSGGSGGVVGALGKFFNLIDKLNPEITLLTEGFKFMADGLGKILALAGESSAYVRERASGEYIGGASPGGGAQSAAVGGFFGLSPSSMGQLAEAFGERLRQGGYGSSVARSQGIVDVGWSTIDKSQNLLKMLDYLRTIASHTQAILVARTLGLEGMLTVRDTSDIAWNQLKNSSSLSLRKIDERPRTNRHTARHTRTGKIRFKRGLTPTSERPFRWDIAR